MNPIVVHLSKAGKYWRVWWLDNAGRRRYRYIGRQSEIGKLKASQIRDKIQAEFARDPRLASIAKPDMPARELVEIIGQRRGAGKTLDGYKATASLLSEIMGEAKPDAITRGQASFLRDTLRERGMAEQTIRNHCGRLRTAWSDAIKEGRLSENVWDHLPRGVVRMEKEWDYIPAESVVSLLDKTDADRRVWLVLARFLGMRASEIERATWDDYDRGKRLWVVYSPNNRITTKHRKRIVPLTPMAYELVGKLDRNAPLVSCTADTARRGIAPWKDPLQALRRAWITDMCEEYAPAIVADLAGNSVDVIMRHYHKVSPETIARITGVST